MAAGTDPVCGRSWFAQGPRIHASRYLEKGGGIPQVDRVRLRRREFDAVERLRDEVVDEQTLDDVDDRRDAAQSFVAIQLGEATRDGIEFERRQTHSEMLAR